MDRLRRAFKEGSELVGDICPEFEGDSEIGAPLPLKLPNLGELPSPVPKKGFAEFFGETPRLFPEFAVLKFVEELEELMVSWELERDTDEADEDRRDLLVEVDKYLSKETEGEMEQE